MDHSVSLDDDRAHLLHPLHHPSAYASTRIWVSGEGALIKDAKGREYIDGLSGLWNVNVGHGRQELAEAARQMATLAFHSTYAGSTNELAIALAERLSKLVFPSINTFFFHERRRGGFRDLVQDRAVLIVVVEHKKDVGHPVSAFTPS